MNALSTVVLSLSLMFSTAGFAVDESHIKLLRLAIVDTSTSMNGPRIAVVEDELRRILQQTPPSPEFPFALVTFASTADKARVFLDLDQALAAVAGLTPYGDTNIAAGLASGIEELRGYTDAAHIAVLFYSDGADANLAGILAEEAKLDALFAIREKTGLKQTVVFKRWGNTNSALKQKIEERGRSRVVDAGEGSAAALKFESAIQVADVRWSATQADVLEIDILPTVAVRGDMAELSATPFRFSCLTPGVSGDVTFEVDPAASSPKRYTLRIPTKSDDPVSELTVPFELTIPDGESPEMAFLLPLLAATQVDAKVSVPPRQCRNLYTVSCEFPQPARWTDPLQLRAAFPIELHFDMQSLVPTSKAASATFRIKPGPGINILKGKTVFTIPGPGAYSLPLTLELSPKNPQAALDDVMFAFQLTLAPENVPAHTFFEPDHLDIDRSDLPAPAAVCTTVSAISTSAGSAMWVDLLDATSVADVQVRVRVEGPLPPGSKLTLTAPPIVSKLEIQPHTLRSGEQTVTVRVVGRLPVTPQTLSLVIVPPQARGAIVPTVTQPLKVTLASPAPVQLMFSNGREVLRRLRAKAADNADAIELSVIPVLSELGPFRQIESLHAALLPSDGQLQPLDTAPLQLFKTHQVRLRMSHRPDLPFFTDSVWSGELELRPSRSTPAIVGSRYPVDVTVEAPFRRLFFLFVIVLSPLIFCLITARMFMKFRQPQN